MRATLRAADVDGRLPEASRRWFRLLHGDGTLVLLPKYWEEITVAPESEVRFFLQLQLLLNIRAVLVKMSGVG
jgi:hypothetical protein